MSIIIARADDMDEVKSFVSQEEIWENACDTTQEPALFNPRNDENGMWIVAKKEEELIGVIYIHHDNSYTLKMHPYLLNCYKADCREFMKAFYRWFLDVMPEQIIKCVAVIDETKRSVLSFAFNMGFTREGLNRLSLIKNGVKVDQVYFGITRDEMKERI